MDFQGKSVDKGGPGSPQARVDEQRSDLVTLLKDFPQRTPSEAMASQRKVVDEGNAVAKGKCSSHPVKIDEQAIDVMAMLTPAFTQLFQVSPTKESGTSGSAETGEVSAFNALFQAPLGTKIHDKRQEIDDLYHCMREILHNPKYMDGDRLSPEDEIAVRNVLKFHPNCEQKTGPGIAYIKIQKIYDDIIHCFWVVHADGTEIDFSFHKCLKEKAAKECPEYRNNFKTYVPRRASQRNGAYTRF